LGLGCIQWGVGTLSMGFRMLQRLILIDALSSTH
jgi:hypothetical protein